MKVLAGVLPFAALVLLCCWGHRTGRSWRASILRGAVWWGLAVTLITEGLSALDSLSSTWTLSAWLTLCIALALGCLRSGNVTFALPRRAIPRLGAWWLALGGVTVIVSAIGVVALAAPPNTVDSMVYHMPRVAHWIQNGGVAHYPTHTPRQLHLAPWAEFAILQPQILGRGDRLANFVQWLAMLGSLVGVSLIARQLGGNAGGQILAAVVCATIPMGILQASGTQNDYVVSFWLVCFLYSWCRFIQHGSDDGDPTEPWWMGTSLGLAILTKATAYLFALPFLLWMILDGVRHKTRRTWKTFGIVILAALLLNAGYYSRNLRTYGSPLGPGREGPFVYANEVFTPSSLVSNVMRNLALHVATPSEPVNAVLTRAVEWLHDRLGARIDEPKTTWPGETLRITPPRAHEDFDGNLVHLVLIAISCLILLTAPPLRRRRDLQVYAGAVIAGFLLFALYLKWQPWHSRLHLPLFVLWAPLVGTIWGHYRWGGGVVCAMLLVLSGPWVVYNRSRPLLGHDTVIRQPRVDQYFINRRDLREPYLRAIQKLREAGCSTIGLWLDSKPEYPLWVLAGREGGQTSTRIRHIYVDNESARSVSEPERSFSPCAILLIVDHPSIPATLPYNGATYGLRFQAMPVSLFLRE